MFELLMTVNINKIAKLADNESKTLYLVDLHAPFVIHLDSMHRQNQGVEHAEFVID